MGGGVHGQIGGYDGKNALCIAHRYRASDHPDLTAFGVKVGLCPYARVLGEWGCEPVLRLYVIGGSGKVCAGLEGQ